MKLAAALQILADARELPAKPVFLACGFTPLHLQTYLAAHLQLAYPRSRVDVATGLYGDLSGNLGKIPQGAPAAVVIEWADLDPRLGFRSLGGWTVKTAADILQSVPSRLQRMAEQLRQVSQSSLVSVVLPCTPLAPVSFTPHWMADPLTLEIRRLLAEFAASIAAFERVRILSSDALALFEGSVFQLKSELDNGFPYSMAFADFLAEQLAISLAAPLPKKGLITDLDDTLWAGILGEDGIEGLRWTLEGHAQAHGLYQQLLASLAESGVLLAVASKNDPALVTQAFSRLPLALPAEHLFPVVANWERKSRSVQQILAAWNIGPQDVVFIDDSPAELEEVKSAFPEITCVQFKGADATHCHRLLLQLRTLFGKARLQAEDALRAASLKSAAKVQQEKASAVSEDDFIAGLGATLTVSLDGKFVAGRALELINKTNQFNLNGRRYELPEWAALAAQPGRLLLTVEYLDKHGSLGRIAVLAGLVSGSTLQVDAWVLSCRAFARRIEYALLELLFRELGVASIELAYEPTPRNGPIRDFLQTFGSLEPGAVRIDRATFTARSPRLFHEIRRQSEVET